MMITDILKIDLPIIQSPMAGVQDSELAIAVCRAGGLGSLPAAMLTLDKLESELVKLKAINRPYSVNFFVHEQEVFSDSREQKWRGILEPYYQEFNIDKDSIVSTSFKQSFTQDHVDVLEKFKPALVSFHFGLPDQALLKQIKQWGSKIISSATHVKEAIWLEENGVDIVIAQGYEAGGHRGMFLTDDLTTQVGTLSLLPQLIESINLPVIAAGGIADAKTVSAMIELGASGVQVGTAFLLCTEAKTSVVHRAALKSAQANHTAITNVFSGRPARSIVNKIIREIGPLNPSVPAFLLAGGALAELRKTSEANQQSDFTPLWSGQNNLNCEEISATRITKKLAKNL